jgi:hypothetical protein
MVGFWAAESWFLIVYSDMAKEAGGFSVVLFLRALILQGLDPRDLIIVHWCHLPMQSHCEWGRISTYVFGEGMKAFSPLQRETVNSVLGEA